MSNTATKSKRSRTSKSRATGRTGKVSKKSAKTKRTSASSKTANKDGGKRLRPGQLDGMVLGYMKKNRDKLPVTAGAIGRGINRSSGAIANSLARSERTGKVKLTSQKPREYDLVRESK